MSRSLVMSLVVCALAAVLGTSHDPWVKLTQQHQSNPLCTAGLFSLSALVWRHSVSILSAHGSCFVPSAPTCPFHAAQCSGVSPVLVVVSTSLQGAARNTQLSCMTWLTQCVQRSEIASPLYLFHSALLHSPTHSLTHSLTHSINATPVPMRLKKLMPAIH